METTCQLVKKIIEEVARAHGVRVLKVFLFGSRAREDSSEESDWDFLVIVDKNMSFHKKWDMVDEIKRRLARLSIPNDIIVRSEREFSETSRQPGTISFEVAKEGIPL